MSQKQHQGQGNTHIASQLCPKVALYGNTKFQCNPFDFQQTNPFSTVSGTPRVLIIVGLSGDTDIVTLMIEESKKGTTGITKGPRARTAARAARRGADAVTLTPARSFKDVQALGETRARVRSVFASSSQCCTARDCPARQQDAPR